MTGKVKAMWQEKQDEGLFILEQFDAAKVKVVEAEEEVKKRKQELEVCRQAYNDFLDAYYEEK